MPQDIDYQRNESSLNPSRLAVTAALIGILSGPVGIPIVLAWVALGLPHKRLGHLALVSIVLLPSTIALACGITAIAVRGAFETRRTAWIGISFSCVWLFALLGCMGTFLYMSVI